MKTGLALVLGTLLVAAALAATPTSTKCVLVRLPQGWQVASRVTLALKDVTVPNNRSAVFRVVTVNSAGRETFLGSFGVVGVSPTASGQTTRETVRVDVTASLARWGREHAAASELQVCVLPVDGARRRIDDLQWSMAEVTLELH
jgi:hypothetical protein